MSPGSRIGLKVMIGAPRRLARCSRLSMRGLLVVAFCPNEKMQSALSKSSSHTVPTGTPIDFGSPTDVLSWHMLELLGRLLVPNIRAKSCHIYAVSSEAWPDR